LTLFVDVQGVPNAILELVKARILANRKRNKEKKSAATALKVQQPARRRYYSPVAPDRRPEPAAIPGNDGIAVAIWEEVKTLNDDNQIASRKVTVRNAAGTDSVTFTYNLPTFAIPEDVWFEGGNGISFTSDGIVPQEWRCSFGPPPAVFPVSTFRKEYFDVGLSESKTIFCLPVSASATLLVYRSRGAAAWWHAKVETINTAEVAEWRRAGGAEYCLGGGFNEGWGLDFNERVFTTVTTDGPTSPAQWSETRCFLITSNQIKSIAPPSGLIAALEKYEPVEYELQPATIGSYLPTGAAIAQQPSPGFAGTRGWVNNDDTSWISFYAQLNSSQKVEPYRLFTWGTTPGLAGEKFIGGFDVRTYFSQPLLVNKVQPVDPSPSFDELRASIPLLTCYGIGALSTTNHSTAGSTPLYSPAMFTFLKDIDSSILVGYDDINEYRDAMLATNASYSYIKSNYLADAPTPTTFYAPCALSESCPVNSPDGVNISNIADSCVSFDKAIVAPANHNVALNVPDDFSKGIKATKLVDLKNSERLLYSWAWRKPAYCRQQLLALGFTAADLTP
jgi:hypothetical protein